MKKFVLGAIIMLISATTAFAQNDKAEEVYMKAADLIHQKQWKEGLELMKSNLKLDLTPDFRAKYLTMCGMLCRDSLLNRDKALDYFKKADALYDQVLAMQSDSLDITIIFAEMGLTQYADTAKQYQLSLEHCDKGIKVIRHIADNRIRAVDMDGNDLVYMYNTMRLHRAGIYNNAGDFENAEVAYDESIADFRALQLSGDSDLVTGGYSFGAMAIFGKLSMLLERKKDIPAAISTCKEMDKILTEALNNDNETVKEVITTHLPMYLLLMSQTYLAADDLQNAIMCCNDALSWPSADMWKPIIINTRGEICLKAGDEDEARKCWEQVKELVPFFYDNDKNPYPLQEKFGK